MIYIGIDPGMTGSMCIKHNDKIEFYDYKTEGILGYSEAILTVTFEMKLAYKITLEKVHSMSGQGVKSVFSFGQRLGELEGMLQTLDVEYDTVRPQTWQKSIGVPVKSGKEGIYNVVRITLEDDSVLLGPKGGIKDGKCDALGIVLHTEKVNS